VNPPAAAVPSVVAAGARVDAFASCSAVWEMLAFRIPSVVLLMSECVLNWALDHLESQTGSSERKHNPSWSLAFGASYVPSHHVVSNVGPAPCSFQQAAIKWTDA
jgi:hypothetical protein